MLISNLLLFFPAGEDCGSPKSQSQRKSKRIQNTPVTQQTPTTEALAILPFAVKVSARVCSRSNRRSMIKRVTTVYPLEGTKLIVWFQGGESRLFDCKKNLSRSEFAQIKKTSAFENAEVTAAGYAVSWNDEIDVTSKDLFEKGQPIDVTDAEQARLIAEVAEARKQRGISQSQLESMTGVRQPVIARMETGASAPRLDTLMKVLAPLGKTLRVVDIAN